MKKTKLMNRIIVLALFVFYMYALLRIILFKFRWRDMTFLWHQLQRNLGNPDNLMYQLQRGNFIPFKTIFINSQSLSWHDLSNLVGNIALFIPFGMVLVLLSKNKGMSFIGVLALSLSLSLYLECFQVVFSIGIFDVDDLILNTSGGLLGYCAIKLYDKVYSKFIVNTSSIVQDRDIVENQEFKNIEEGEPYHK
ncbi:VanZ family protein [Bacillus sp. ISL-40]|uniref:VanZ family protein n=1 Tax=unclassified Bacillus (in: firmicutes) TaxID=185979 RepID=UPI001BE5240B|nr:MULTISPECIES: VanZ family protein [unclassified Bacillus (in: firmicutes)]MBT2700714.1 VanZ family protein [Bacillus sp. ISL-40]MBT2722997.1 VanZ family protein [Bacillus sp. ISL-46]MBT2744208.1 VanZ family protein [Bacillus sp. ISL-77]